MTIAILDDGICDGIIDTKIDHIDLLEGGQQIPFPSHGTVCAKIIEKYGKANRFIDIRFLDQDRSGSIKGLITALKCCLKMDIDLINISCGIDLFMEDDPQIRELHRIIRRVCAKGTRIFAAQSNIGRITVPAAFPEVISVEHKSFFRNRIHSVYRISDLYIRAPRMVRLGKKRVVTYLQNSYSCAMACAQASRCKLDIKSGKDLRYYVPTINDRIKVPIVFIKKDKESGRLALSIKRALQEKGYYTNIICDTEEDRIPGAHVIRNGRSGFRLARYIRESYATVIIYISRNDTFPIKGLKEAFSVNDGRLKVLCNKLKRQSPDRSSICKLVEKTMNDNERTVGRECEGK